MRNQVYFREQQRFNQGWFIALMAVISMAALVPLAIGFYMQIILHEPWGDQPMSDTGMIALCSGMLFAIIGANLIVFSSRLETKIEDHSVLYRYPPLINKWVKVNKTDINGYQIKKFHPLFDFGGWGYRMGFKRKRAFHIKGNMGLSMELASGKTILLGTQKPDMLHSAMRKLMKPTEEF
ncbi:MAG: hypothetical protein ACR2MX_18025 [Cyclobacteriaceae bacterium]